MSPDGPDREEGFLTRWSRRKREIAAEGAKPAEPAAPPAIAPQPAPELALAAPEPDEEFDLSLLPDVETLTAESDITLFLRKGVPEALKNAALRKMWSADAAIRDYIGPVDYQWDFNDPAGVPGFGPLGEDVDIEAMLRQVIGEKKPPPESVVAEEEKVSLPEHLHQTKVEEEADTVPPPAADEQAALPESAPGNGNENEIAEDSVPKEDISTPKPRRHGGALPL